MIADYTPDHLPRSTNLDSDYPDNIILRISWLLDRKQKMPKFETIGQLGCPIFSNFGFSPSLRMRGGVGDLTAAPAWLAPDRKQQSDKGRGKKDDGNHQ